VHTIIKGYAASAATLISFVANRRFIHKYSSLMMHVLRSTSECNKYSQRIEEVDNMASMIELIKKIYKEHTKLNNKELDKFLIHDRDWYAEECLKYSLVDEIIQ